MTTTWKQRYYRDLLDIQYMQSRLERSFKLEMSRIEILIEEAEHVAWLEKTKQEAKDGHNDQG